VTVQKGLYILKCEKLILFFNKNGGKKEPETMEAEGNVHLFTQDGHRHIWSDHAIFNKEKEDIHFTGKIVKVTLENTELLCDKGLTFNQRTGHIKTQGRGTLSERSRKIEADYITGEFSLNPPKTLKKVYMNGNITITTPEEKGTADEGAYDAINQKGELWGNVVLLKGKHTMTGAVAYFNLKEGTMSLSAFPHFSQKEKKKRRVKIVLSSEKKGTP
jgi:lipopolysaccharide export system protein LptA